MDEYARICIYFQGILAIKYRKVKNRISQKKTEKAILLQKFRAFAIIPRSYNQEYTLFKNMALFYKISNFSIYF